MTFKRFAWVNNAGRWTVRLNHDSPVTNKASNADNLAELAVSWRVCRVIENAMFPAHADDPGQAMGGRCWRWPELRSAERDGEGPRPIRARCLVLG